MRKLNMLLFALIFGCGQQGEGPAHSHPQQAEITKAVREMLNHSTQQWRTFSNHRYAFRYLVRKSFHSSPTPSISSLLRRPDFAFESCPPLPFRWRSVLGFDSGYGVEESRQTCHRTPQIASHVNAFGSDRTWRA